MLGIRAERVRVLKDLPHENASWLAELAGGTRVVLRRYHQLATDTDLAYEHEVLSYLAAAGWVVPAAAGDLIRVGELWYCLTRYVPGEPATSENAGQQQRRGRDLARLHLALRFLGERIGQRHGWRAQHRSVTVHASVDWHARVADLAQVSPRLGDWAAAAAEHTRGALTAIGASELPVMVVHGDFAEWNVHYVHDRLAGVIDFGLTHLDSRPYELAIARTWRAPHAIDGYRSELARNGWPLTELEEAAIVPVYHAFRLDMSVWQVDYGLRTGRVDLAAIERQLARTGTAPP